MNKTRYQVYRLQKAIDASAKRENFYVTLDDNYKYCTGVSFIRRDGAGTYILLGLEDENLKILDDAPLHVLEINPASLDKSEVFQQVFFEAKGNSVKVVLDFITVTTAIDMDIVFRLENEPVLPKILRGYQYKLLTVPAGTNGAYENTRTTIILNTNFQKVVKAVIYTATAIRFAIKNESGEYLLNRIPSQLISSNTDLPYESKGFPVEIPINGAQKVHFEVETFSALGANLYIPITLFLEKEFGK